MSLFEGNVQSVAPEALLNDDVYQVTVGQLASIRKLMFDAQTLSAAQVKQAIAGSEAARKAELVPAETSVESCRAWS